MKEEKKESKKKKSSSKKSSRKRGFFGRLFVFLLTILAFIGVMAMAMSVLSSYVDPVKFPWMAYFGLAFWVIFLYNIMILMFLLLLWSRMAWFSIIALIISIPGVYKSFSAGSAQEGGELRVMSYNVLNFSDYHGLGKSREEVANRVANFVLENNPDVLCIQEFSEFMPKLGRKDCIAKYGELLKMPYQYYHTKQHYGSNVIFSKYPLSALDADDAMGGENAYGPVAKVDAGKKGVFYVVCCHLTSFQLTNEEITVFSDTGNSKEEVKTKSKSILVKLKNAYEKRSQEVSKMLEDIPNDGRAIVLCGDFNDTPLSYTYHQIKRAGFTDGFVKVGRGVGRTYAGKLPMLRIDYVWGNDQIQPTAFKRLKFKGSDHFPVMMDFNLNHGL